MSDFLKAIASRATRAAGGGNWFRQGRGRVMLTSVTEQLKDAGPTFIVEAVVVSSESYPGAVNDKGQPESANAPGSTVSWLQQFAKFKSAIGQVKAFVLAVSNEDENEVSEADLEAGIVAIISKSQPLKGMYMDFETYQKAIKSGPNIGKLLTLVKWVHVPGQTADEIKARRAEFEKTAPAAA